MTVTDHAADDEAFDGKMRYTWSYDEPYAPERDLAGEALHETDSADTCLLTLIYDPGTADEETQQYRVTARQLCHVLLAVPAAISIMMQR